MRHTCVIEVSALILLSSRSAPVFEGDEVAELWQRSVVSWFGDEAILERVTDLSEESA